MAKYRIGLQTITFGDWQVENMPAVMDAAVQSGYDGVEVGYRRLGSTPPGDLATLRVSLAALRSIETGGVVTL